MLHFLLAQSGWNFGQKKSKLSQFYFLFCVWFCLLFPFRLRFDSFKSGWRKLDFPILTRKILEPVGFELATLEFSGKCFIHYTMESCLFLVQTLKAFCLITIVRWQHLPLFTYERMHVEDRRLVWDMVTLWWHVMIILCHDVVNLI